MAGGQPFSKSKSLVSLKTMHAIPAVLIELFHLISVFCADRINHRRFCHATTTSWATWAMVVSLSLVVSSTDQESTSSQNSPWLTPRPFPDKCSKSAIQRTSNSHRSVHLAPAASTTTNCTSLAGKTMTMASWTTFGSMTALKTTGIKFKSQTEVLYLSAEVATRRLHLETRCIFSEASSNWPRSWTICLCSTSTLCASSRERRGPTSWTAVPSDAKVPLNRTPSMEAHRRPALRKVVPAEERLWVRAQLFALPWSVDLAHQGALWPRELVVLQPSARVSAHPPQ